MNNLSPTSQRALELIDMMDPKEVMDTTIGTLRILYIKLKDAYSRLNHNDPNVKNVGREMFGIEVMIQAYIMSAHINQYGSIDGFDFNMMMTEDVISRSIN